MPIGVYVEAVDDNAIISDSDELPEAEQKDHPLLCTECELDNKAIGNDKSNNNWNAESTKTVIIGSCIHIE